MAKIDLALELKISIKVKIRVKLQMVGAIRKVITMAVKCLRFCHYGPMIAGAMVRTVSFQEPQTFKARLSHPGVFTHGLSSNA